MALFVLRLAITHLARSLDPNLTRQSFARRSSNKYTIQMEPKLDHPRIKCSFEEQLLSSLLDECLRRPYPGIRHGSLVNQNSLRRQSFSKGLSYTTMVLNRKMLTCLFPSLSISRPSSRREKQDLTAA
ncbi:hypothetical protein R3P38DRAFT_1112611 [Favolaschia claudopus]|uniref:Uncharacterized protein n=1 Tax=Favolaschia claudopus TaxID=2862362 RepID=A0AAW0BBE9_9AGAR